MLLTMYFVLDGLDEVLEAERRLLLETVLKLQEEHKNLKLLISSRLEHDIVRILSPNIKPICVEDGNGQDIQRYVQQRLDMWLSGLPIDPEDRADIEVLLGSIEKSAKGMFLYARLVCDNLECQSDVEAVKAEINNLPSGLNEVYGRILSRIEKDLHPQARLEAKQILEWVSCSLDLVTKNEIQLALMIACGKDSSHGCRGLFMDIFQRCGPIIEEVNGYVQFVYFSAREFLLHAQSGLYLKEAKAHANIGSICIHFLSSHCFDEELPDDIIREHIADGSFLLENYVCRRWFDHIMKCVESALEMICRDIECLVDKRENYDFGPSSDANSARKSLNGFAGFPKELQTVLMNLDSFWRSRRRNFCFKKIENWENLDLFTISKHQARVRRIFEKMLCSGSDHVVNCSCAELRSLYGSHIYGCSRPGCAHYRLFKCDFIDCPYYDLGFNSTSLLQNHISTFHNASSISNSDCFSQLVEVKAVVEDAIDLDDMYLVRDMQASVRMHGAYFMKICLMRGSSPEMLRLILNICKDHRISLRWSWYIDWLLGKPNGHPELFRILMEQGMIKVGDFDDIANTSSPEMFELFAEYGAGARNYQKLFRKLLPAKPDTLAEINALKCMRAMGNALDIRGYETCLIVLSDRNCSVSIARFCLENGASVEAPLARGMGGESPFKRAARKTTPEAAQLREFLCEHSALY
ncbi:hypothetical protein CDV55_107640 [Aspergillus turcosus]|uniref:NACHT domain-containing protein n=1 Tax=Aspergillus turcosus TaxID=1245748 RepID=A0A397HSN4_9EURO|nr:hypothetical protein CDV55_107640 [Aspergillus turcosus]RLL97092.1 hypothetical protein CFD26_106377 [Aspergillus turcosus]